MAGTDRTQASLSGGPPVIRCRPQLGENVGLELEPIEWLELRARPRVEDDGIQLDLALNAQELGRTFDAYARARLERGGGVLLLRFGSADRRRCALLWVTEEHGG